MRHLGPFGDGLQPEGVADLIYRVYHGVVDRIITNLGVLDVAHKGLQIVELAPGVTHDEIVAATEARIV